MIDQGYSYLSKMLNNKSDFILEYNEQKNNNLKRDEVDWSQSKIIFVSPSFNSYQKNSINFKDVPFELWEIKKYSNNTISLNQYLSTSKESIQKLEGNQNSVIKDVGKEVKVFEEVEHTSKCSKELLQKWNQLRENLSEFEGVELVPKRDYISLMLGNKTISYFIFRKESIVIELGRGNVKTDGEKSRNYFDIDDPKSITEDRSWTWRDGTQGTLYVIRFKKNSDIDYIIFLIKQKFKNISN